MKTILIIALYLIFPLTGNTAIPTEESFQQGIYNQEQTVSSTKLSEQQAVSLGIVYKEEKPVCYFSAFENKLAVPEQFTLSQTDIQLDLPECNQEEIYQTEYAVQNSLFIKEGTQLAVAPLVYGAYALCGASGLVGGALALNRLKKHDHDLEVSTVGSVTSLGGAATLGFGSYAVDSLLYTSTSYSSFLRVLGNAPFIAGACAFGGSAIAYLGSIANKGLTFTPSSSED